MLFIFLFAGVIISSPEYSGYCSCASPWPSMHRERLRPRPVSPPPSPPPPFTLYLKLFCLLYFGMQHSISFTHLFIQPCLIAIAKTSITPQINAMVEAACISRFQQPLKIKHLILNKLGHSLLHRVNSGGSPGAPGCKKKRRI